MPRESHTTTSRTPARCSRRVTATPAAPAPETTTRRSGSCRPSTFAALSSPASTTIAVPCWSSWNTGMSRRSLSCSSMSKQRGAEMSSRLMPPYDGAIRAMASTSSSTVPVSMTTGHGVDAGEVLEEHRLALHHRQRPERADVAQAQHRRAVADDRHGVAPRGVAGRQGGVRGDRERDLRDAGGVQQGQVLAVAQRLRRVYPQLPALVSAKDRALRVEEGDVGRRGHGAAPRGRCGGPPARGGGRAVREAEGGAAPPFAARGGVRGCASSHSADSYRGVTRTTRGGGRIGPVHRAEGVPCLGAPP